MPPRKRKSRALPTAATTPAEAPAPTPMETDSDRGGGDGGGGAGGGGGGGAVRAAKRARPTPAAVTTAFAPKPEALTAALNDLNEMTGLIPDINAIVCGYSAPSPLRWTQPKRMASAESSLRMAVSADGRIADAMDVKSTSSAAVLSEPPFGEATALTRVRVEIVASGWLRVSSIPKPIGQRWDCLMSKIPVLATTVDMTMTVAHPAAEQGEGHGDEGLLTISRTVLTAEPLIFRIESNTRLLVSGHGVRLTLLDSE
jgi:hypothetical protein